MGKKWRRYTVVSAGKKSKVWAKSKDGAEKFAENVIEIRASHSLLKSYNGKKGVKAYFSDTGFMKNKLNIGLLGMITAIQNKKKTAANKPKPSTSNNGNTSTNTNSGGNGNG